MKISLSSRERHHLIGLLERENRMAVKALNTPTIGYNNYNDFKNTIHNNNVTIEKLKNENKN